MEGEQRDISATILTEVPNTVMHRFVDQQKNLFTSGTHIVIQAHARSPKSRIPIKIQFSLSTSTVSTILLITL